eukprot:364100-Chlamydomonas_euryale.AAC.11
MQNIYEVAAIPLKVLAHLSGTKGCKVPLCSVPPEAMCSRRVNARGKQARSACPTNKALMTQSFIHDAMKTMNHSKAADAVVMTFYVNGWAYYCMSNPFFQHMVQLIAAGAPGFKLPSYAKRDGEMLQS